MTVRAYTVQKDGDQIIAGVNEVDEEDLGAGEVVLRAAWSAINYKDAMVTKPGNRVTKLSLLIPGVDVAGVVESSTDPSFSVGDRVLAQAYDLGVAHHGGFAEKVRVPASWVVPLPDGLDARQAMIVGTAGFTALVSLHQLEERGLTASAGPVLVTGASGGVGSMTVALLAAHGYHVVASTGKTHEHDYLTGLGAAEVIGRDIQPDDPGRVLGPQLWAGAIDCVGGATLATVLRTLRYGAAVAASGLTGGSDLATTVYPFIVRNVALLGVDTVDYPIEERRTLWRTMAERFAPELLETMVDREIGLDGLTEALGYVLSGATKGRVLVQPDR
jgi:acrylyl-CoA reductase (NADPH)